METTHLPGLPSAKEIENNDGYSVGEIQKELLTKIEELHLYILRLQDDI
jgi:hypothetical protein